MGEKKRLLHITHSTGCQETLASYLSQEYELQEVFAQEDAEAALMERGREIRAILIDDTHPEAQHFSIIRWIRKNAMWTGIPIAVLASDGDELREIDALNAGAAEFIRIPCHPDTLRLRIQTLMDPNRTNQPDLTDRLDSQTGVLREDVFFQTAQQTVLDNPNLTHWVVCAMISNLPALRYRYPKSRINDIRQRLAVCLRQLLCPKHGFVGLTVGDRFAVCIPCTETQLRVILTCIQNQMSQFPLDLEIRLRFGICPVEDINADIRDIFARATDAAVNGEGTDQYCVFYQDYVQQKLAQRLNGAFPDAVATERFFLRFEPCYDLTKGKLIAAAVQLCWQVSDDEVLEDKVFLPVVSSHIIFERLMYLYFEMLCRFVTSTAASGAVVPPLILSPALVTPCRSDCGEYMTRALANAGLPASHFPIRVPTDGPPRHDIPLKNAVEQLRRAGFPVILSNPSSTICSKEQSDSLQGTAIELNLIRYNTSSASDTKIVGLNTAVQVMQWSQLPLLAKGVKTTREAAFLRSIGVSMARGPLFSEPLLQHDFVALLSESSTKEGLLHANVPQSLLWNTGSPLNLWFDQSPSPALLLVMRRQSLSVLRANDSYFAAWCQDRASFAVCDRELTGYLHPQHRDALIQACTAAFTTGKEQSISVLMRLPGGKSRYHSVRCAVKTLFRQDHSAWITMQLSGNSSRKKKDGNETPWSSDSKDK